jgi:hypothetical protein
MLTKPIPVQADPPDPKSDAYDALNAQILVTLSFQQEVNEGRGEWWTNDDGQTELHLASGEVFLLLENEVSRLK